MIQMLVGPIANVAGQFLKNRAEKVKAKQQLAVAKIEAQTKKYKAMRTGKKKLWMLLKTALKMNCGQCCL